MERPSHPGDRRLGLPAIMSCVLTVVTLGVTAVSQAVALDPGPPFKNQGLAIVNGGVLWFDERQLLLKGPRWGTRLLGASSSEEDEFSSSATAVAAPLENDESLGESGYLAASVLPRRLSSIALPRRLSGGGCTWWEPSTDLVVVEDDLVAGG